MSQYTLDALGGRSQLAAPHVPGSGTITLTIGGGSLWAAASSGTPGVLMVGDTSGNQTVFACTASAADVLTGVTAAEGRDQYFAAGSTARVCALTSGGSGGSGTVTSIVAGTGLSGGTITTTGTIALAAGAAAANLGTTGIEVDSHYGVITQDTQSTGTWPVNLATSDWHTVTLTANISTLTLSNGTVGQQFTLVIIQGGSGSYTVAWPANTKWPGGSAPTLTTTVGGIDVVTIKIVSTGLYYAFVAGKALA